MPLNAVLYLSTPILLGALAGSFSGYSLIRGISFSQHVSSRQQLLIPLLRLGVSAGIGWYLLQWGIIPVILFGGSLVIAKWIAILALHE